MTSPLVRVLVVDDEAPFTRMLKLGLEGTQKFLVETENNPLAAITRAEHFRPDVILLDVMMPHLDGGDLAVQFQSHARLRTVPIIFLTAAVRKDEVSSNSGRIGGLRFLAKPVELDDLVCCLREALERRP
jgi:CheY-like chemotaxis protein